MLLQAPSTSQLADDTLARWTISAPDLRATLAAPQPRVTVLDVRGWWAYRQGHVPGAVRVSWLDYRNGRGRTGKLPVDLAAVARDLARKGVDGGRPVVVYGRARDGWGEEGRVAWTLAFLGHPRVTVLDGGWTAWRAAGGTVERGVPRPTPGHFEAHPRPAMRATADDVAATLTTAPLGRAAVVLDTRSTAEWEGARRYWPARVGHIPGAVHLEWRDLLDGTGRIDRSPAQRARLATLGLTPDRPVITYCVAGVRSGEAFWALRALGFRDVRNYDGSWYEWAADPRRPVAREPGPERADPPSPDASRLPLRRSNSGFPRARE